MFIGGFIGSIIIRFFVFLFKIISSCIFVVMLQIKIGSYKIEEWIEQSLKTSYFGEQIRQTVMSGQDIITQKIGFLQKNKELVEDKMHELNNLQNEYLEEEEQNTRIPSSY